MNEFIMKLKKEMGKTKEITSSAFKVVLSRVGSALLPTYESPSIDKFWNLTSIFGISIPTLFPWKNNCQYTITRKKNKKKNSCVWFQRKCTKEITNHASPPRPKYNSFLKRARILIWKKKTISQSFHLKIIWKFFGKPCSVLVFRNNFLFKNKNCCWLDDFWNNQT